MNKGKKTNNNVNKEKVINALKQVYDPEVPVNIYELGLIYNIDIDLKNKVIEVTMTLTSPNCPMADQILNDVDLFVKKETGFDDVKIDLVFDPPWDKSKMSEKAQIELGFFNKYKFKYMKKELLTIIEKIKNFLNESEENNKHFINGRNLAFAYLNIHKLTEKEIKIIEKYDLLNKLKVFFDNLENSKEKEKNKKIGINDQLNITSKDKCEFNFLEFNEITEEELFIKYLFNNVDERTDFFTLLNLSIVDHGGVLYFDSEQEFNSFVYFTQIKSMPLGQVLLVIVDSFSKAKLFLNNSNDDDLSLGSMRVYVENDASLHYIYLHNPKGKNYILGQDIILKNEAQVVINPLFVNGSGYLNFNTQVLGKNATCFYKTMYLANQDDNYWFDFTNNINGQLVNLDFFVYGLALDTAKVVLNNNYYIHDDVWPEFVNWQHAAYRFGGSIETIYDEDILENEFFDSHEKVIDIKEKEIREFHKLNKEESFSNYLFSEYLLKNFSNEFDDDVITLVNDIVNKKLKNS